MLLLAMLLLVMISQSSFVLSLRLTLKSVKHPQPRRWVHHFITSDHDQKDANLLHIRNPHTNDARIKFYEHDHRYTFDDEPIKWSVTSLIQRYFHQFDASSAVNKMMSGKYWPRKEYCHPSGEPFTAEEVMQTWSTIGESARSQGSKLHQNIEMICNGLDPPHKHMSELHQFREFYESLLVRENISPFRTEWRIAAQDLSIAGSVDFVGVNSENDVILIDWKRSKKISPSYEGVLRFAQPPIDHIPDSDFSKYMLQLNMYDFILDRYYNIRSKKMLLVFLHPSLTKPFVFKVPKLRQEIELIVRDSKHSRS